MYGIPAHSDICICFENEIVEIYAVYDIKQSTTMSYNPHGSSQFEGFNHTLHDLLRRL